MSDRTDLSPYIFHLTTASLKGVDNEVVIPPRVNLLSILRSLTVRAPRPCCYFNKGLDDLPAERRSMFNVACFTELPLHELHAFGKDGYHPEEGDDGTMRYTYGVVIPKELAVERGCQPVLYVTNSKRQAAWNLFYLWKEHGNVDPGLLPYFTIMNRTYDFSHQREWRSTGDFRFQLHDLAGVILPSTGDDDLKAFLERWQVPVARPRMGRDEIHSLLAGRRAVIGNYYGQAASDGFIKDLQSAYVAELSE